MFVACSDDNFDTLTGNENTGGLVSVNKVNIGYVVGNGDTFQYTLPFKEEKKYRR